MTISIAREFTMTPGGRYISEGDFSGELFREKLLWPAFAKAKETNEELVIDLDGGYGYGTSFLDESFGGLARKIHDPDLRKIRIISDEEPELAEKIKQYIENGLKDR